MTDCKRYFPDIQAQGDCRNCGWRFEDHEKTGLFNMLSDAQKELALNFDEDESFGPEEFKMNKMKTTITEITVHSEKESPVFGENTITIRLDDDGGGTYLKFLQESEYNVNVLKIDFSDIPTIMNAIEMLKGGEYDG